MALKGKHQLEQDDELGQRLSDMEAQVQPRNHADRHGGTRSNNGMWTAIIVGLLVVLVFGGICTFLYISNEGKSREVDLSTRPEPELTIDLGASVEQQNVNMNHLVEDNANRDGANDETRKHLVVTEEEKKRLEEKEKNKKRLKEKEKEKKRLEEEEENKKRLKET
eukprot:932625_1